MVISLLSIETILGDKKILSKEIANKFGRGEDYLKKVGTEKIYKFSKISIEDASVIASKKAMESAKVSEEEIIAVFATTCCNTCSLNMPGLASLTGNELGLKNIPMITLSLGCAGGMHALEAAFNFLIKKEKLQDKRGSVLILAGDQFSRASGEFSNTAAIFSDSISAIIVSSSKKGECEILDVESSNLAGNLLSMKIENPTAKKENAGFFLMDGKEVLKFASEEVIPEALKISKIEKISSNLYIIPHQASGVVLNSIMDKFSLAANNFYSEGIKNYGNTTGGSIFLGLKDVLARNLSKDKDILLVGFGAELAVGIALLKRNKNK